MKIPKKIQTAKAIAALGNKTKLGKALGISHAAVVQWGEFVPDSRLYQIHYLLTEIDQAEQLRRSL